ncbi:hypothetical protein ACQPYE_24760 [Actinosynnema sp. CA-299493]
MLEEFLDPARERLADRLRFGRAAGGHRAVAPHDEVADGVFFLISAIRLHVRAAGAR